MKKIALSVLIFAILLAASSCKTEPATVSSAIPHKEVSSFASESMVNSEISSAVKPESEYSSSDSQSIESSLTSSKPQANVSSKPKDTSSKPAPKPKPTLEELKQGNSKRANEIIAKITNDKMTDIEKAKATYMWLYPNFKYRYSRVDLSKGYTEQLTHELADYFFRYRKGSCEHYAAAQKVLFQELGFDAYYVQGERYSYGTKKWGEHTWLMVDVDGNMYHVDGLYGGLFYDVKETMFMVPDSALKKTHRWDREAYVPCTMPQILK